MKSVNLKARKGVEEGDSKYCIFAICKEVTHVRGPSYGPGILKGNHFFILTNPTFYIQISHVILRMVVTYCSYIKTCQET
jgi:hypothetical protein